MTAEEVAHIVIRAYNNFTADPKQIINAFSDDASIEYPFAPADIPGFPKVIEGKEAIRKYFYGLTKVMKDIRYAGQHAYHLEGTDMYLLEFTNDGKALPSGKHYYQNLHAIVK